MATTKRTKRELRVGAVGFGNRQGLYTLRAYVRTDKDLQLTLDAGDREYGGIMNREDVMELTTFLVEFLARYPKE